MGTKMGAAGVRIELIDNSGYSVVENPHTVAGVVGFASKGELNKIITLANTAEQDTKLGYGYQSYKYNQGMYAARAVLNAGGHVEFVRPYGETIDKSDAYKRDLKTDAYVITYDKNATMYKEYGAKYDETSLRMKHFASTRYKTDGAAEFGVTRKINNISETITEGSNVNFSIDAADDFADSKECRYYDPNKKLSPTDMVIGAIMNSDPSNAYRAFDRYEILACSYDTSTTSKYPILKCTLATYPAFIVGDTVRLPVSNGGTSNRTATAVVTNISDKVVTLKINDELYNTSGVNKPNAIIYNDGAESVADGYDYMTVKTAVAGRSVKTFDTLHWGDKDNPYDQASSIVNGYCIGLYDKYHEEYVLRFANNLNTVYTTTKSVAVNKDDSGKSTSWTVKVTDGTSIVVGDELTIYVANDTEQAKITVTEVDEDGVTITTTVDTSYTESKLASGMQVAISGFADDYATTVDISAAETWSDVADAVVETLRSSAIGYGNGMITNDIGGDLDGDGVIDTYFSSTTNDLQNIVWVAPSASYDYAIGDKVAIVRGKLSADYGTKVGGTADKTMADIGDTNVFIVSTISDINTLSGKITLVDSIPETLPAKVSFNNVSYVMNYQLIDLTQSAFNIYNSSVTQSYTLSSVFDTENVAYTYSNGMFTTLTSSNIAEKVSVGDLITFSYTTEDSTVMENVGFTVTAVNSSTGVITGTTVSNLPKPASDSGALTEMTAESYVTRDEVDTYIVSNYSLYVSSSEQDTARVFQIDPIDALKIAAGNVSGTPGKYIIDKSSKVLADSDIGATFLSLGLATTDYLDINYDGNPKQVYVLTSDGENVARMFMHVDYMYNGTLYEFEGTVVPYSYNDTQLYIKDAADYELQDSGATFILNDSGVLEYFLENVSYDLSQTVINGTLNGSMTCISYNDSDPAIQNDAVWSYNPVNNRSGSTLSTVWNLFLDKDGSDIDMLVAAGCGINNLFMKGIETLNTQVMEAMLNICELRKDCFAICDGVGEAKIATALTKNAAAARFATTLGRWGAIYDGRGLVYDSVYTKGNAEIVKSVQMASLITSNRTGEVFWIPPSGKDNGKVPSAWGTTEKYPRRFSYPEDTTSDIAKLSNIHCNPTRSTQDGIYIWGDFTMQMEDTAFNQIHVAMLMAGVHKSFYKYLDNKVFRLNTTNLRAQITADLQAKVNAIIRANPAGFYEAKVICDDTNNTAEVIDQNKLYVFLRVKPTKTCRYIYLRSEVQSTSDGNQVTTTLE